MDKRKWIFEAGIGKRWGWGSTEIHVEDIKSFLEYLSDKTIDSIVNDIKKGNRKDAILCKMF